VTDARLPADLTRIVWTLHRRLLQGQKTPAGENVRPPAQVELLRLVADEPGITVRQAAAALRMQPHNVSTLVTRLVNDGYFDRVPDPADRRHIQLFPTTKMLATTAESRAGLYAGVSAALNELPPESANRIAQALPDLWLLAERLAPPLD